MNAQGKLARSLHAGDFIVTAEHTPGPTATRTATEAALKALGHKPVVVNMADNPRGVALSSLAAAATALQMGIEPVLQMVTRDRNRIALQSDLLGAASLGIRNVLCLSGYHQTLMGCPESANVFDVDSTQFIQLTARMSAAGVLADGTKIDGPFAMCVGAVVNPFLKPLELNLLRLGKKVAAGAQFLQTHAVFDLPAFGQWLAAARQEGWDKKTAIIASVFPLDSAAEAEKLRETYPDFCIPDATIERLKQAGANGAQQKAGRALCVETIRQLCQMDGLRGLHLLSGGKETLVPELLAEAGL